MPPKSAKKKKKGGEPQGQLKIKIGLHHIGIDGPSTTECVLPSTSPFYKAKHMIDQVPRGSIVFGMWSMMYYNPSYQKPTRQLRMVESRLMYDAVWLSKIGIAEESFIVVKPGLNSSDTQVTWYINVPEIVSHREKPTKSELARLKFEKFKEDRLGAGKKKKKK